MKDKTIEEALQRASFYLERVGLEDPRVEAEVLLSHLLETDRLQLFLKKAQSLSSRQKYLFEELVRRRASGEPTAYITGAKEFYGYRFTVNRNVLIPRPETELVVDRALHWLNKLKSSGFEAIRVLDLGTGSGILAITIALKVPGITIDAVDISTQALQTAKYNAALHQVKDKIFWHCGDYFDVFKDCTSPPLFNLVVSNPPYLSKKDIEELPSHILEHEPHEALYGGTDGLENYRQIFNRLKMHMSNPSVLLLEVGAEQKNLLENICLESCIFNSIAWHYDLAEHARVLEAEI